MTEKNIPEPIARWLESSPDAMDTSGDEARKLAERYPEFRDDLQSFQSLSQRLRHTREGDPDVPVGEIPVDLRQSLRRQSRAILLTRDGAESSGVDENRAGSRSWVRVISIVTAAAAVLLIAVFLIDPPTRPDEVFVATIDSSILRSDSRVEYRIHATLRDSGYLVILGLEPGGEVFSFYPQINESGSVIDHGVRGPFEAQSKITFPPDDVDAIQRVLKDGKVHFFFVMMDEELAGSEIRRLLDDVRSETASQDPETTGDAALALLERRFDTVNRTSTGLAAE